MAVITAPRAASTLLVFGCGSLLSRQRQCSAVRLPADSGTIAPRSAAVLRLLVGHLKPGGRLAVFDYRKLPGSHRWGAGAGPPKSVLLRQRVCIGCGCTQPAVDVVAAGAPC